MIGKLYHYLLSFTHGCCCCCCQPCRWALPDRISANASADHKTTSKPRGLFFARAYFINVDRRLHQSKSHSRHETLDKGNERARKAKRTGPVGATQQVAGDAENWL